MPNSERDPQRFADLIKELMERTQLSEHEIGAAAGRSRSQVNQWKLGNHLPRPEALRGLADMLEARYPGLGALPRDLMIAAGYREFAPPHPEDTPAADATPARGFVVDLADENERTLWGLKAPRRVRETMVAIWRVINTRAGQAAIDDTFDEVKQSRREMRRRA